MDLVIISKRLSSPRDGQNLKLRSTFAFSSSRHIDPTSHSNVLQILWMMRGIASSIAGDSARIRVTESEPPR